MPQFLSVFRQVTSGLSPPFNEWDILILRKADKAIGTELVYITYLRGEVHVLCMRWRFEREQEEHVEGGQGREKCKYIIITKNKYNFLSVSFQVLTRVMWETILQAEHHESGKRWKRNQQVEKRRKNMHRKDKKKYITQKLRPMVKGNLKTNRQSLS